MVEQGAVSAIIALAASSHNRHLRIQSMEALCKLAVLPGSEAHIIAEVRGCGVRKNPRKFLPWGLRGGVRNVLCAEERWKACNLFLFCSPVTFSVVEGVD